MSPIEDDWILVTNRDYDLPLQYEGCSEMDPGLPLPNPTTSSWQVPPDPLQNYRSTCQLPTDLLDIVIIGSGFSGTSVAWHLLRGSDDTSPRQLKVLMLEARQVCSGATGRNDVEEQYDAAEAALHSHFEKLNFEALKELIDREEIDCEFKWTQKGWDIFLKDEEFELAKRSVEGMKRAGGYGSTLKIFGSKQAAKAAGVKHCKGAIQTRERASLRPYALVTSLLRKLIHNHSLQLHTNTPVTSIISPPNKRNHYEIHTTRGVVKARHVVNATNAWIGHLYPEFRGMIVPTRGQIIHVDAKDLTLDPTGWSFGKEYLVQRPDLTVIFGGGRQFASIPLEVGNADDTAIDLAVSRYLHTFLPSQFSFVKTVGTEPPVQSIREWTGIMGFSHDTQPFVGHSEDEPYRWVIGGFHGHGMVRIYLCAKALAQQVLSETPIPWPDWLPKAYIYSSTRRPATKNPWV